MNLKTSMKKMRSEKTPPKISPSLTDFEDRTKSANSFLGSSKISFQGNEIHFVSSLLSFSLSSSLSLLQYQLFFSASRSMKILSLCSFIFCSGVIFSIFCVLFQLPLQPSGQS